ncbi:MAG: outer membrane beta-barrel protein, partial [Phenylobacterium sp.]|uniref:outer membrane protein n=1 Tax=Phenylobacterium sp. TaxID=1871053 RepID=UPI00301A5671
MKIKLLAGAALAAVAIASGASAREVGWYGAVDAGYHWPMGIDGTSSNNAANGKPYDWTISSAEDWAGFARLGYQVSSHWRVELEGGYRPGKVDSVRGGASNAILGLCAPGVVRTTAAPNCGSPNGDLTSITGMGNVLYDFLPDSVLNPFIGAGVGINNVKADTIVGQFSTITPVGPAATAANPAWQNLTIDDSDTAFAWQGIAGVAWAVTDRLDVDLTYRYLSGSDVTFASKGTNALQPGAFAGAYEDQSLTVG